MLAAGHTGGSNAQCAMLPAPVQLTAGDAGTEGGLKQWSPRQTGHLKSDERGAQSSRTLRGIVNATLATGVSGCGHITSLSFRL